MKNLSLRSRLVIIGVTATVLPLLIITLLSWRQSQQVKNDAVGDCTQMIFSDLDHIGTNIVALCEAQRGSLEAKALSDLRVAATVLEQAGGAKVDTAATVTWNAKNQISAQTQRVELPRMCAGDTWLGQIADPAITAPVVDSAVKFVGGTCTVFQRMNDAGDMLRVATNVVNEGKRAIGTFIPATNPDGQPNPVVSAVLQGQTYSGRATVVGAWYSAAYQPLKDKSGKIIGMLYTGVPEAAATEHVRKAITSLSIGKSGYIYVLNARGKEQGRYVISRGGTLDGQSAWDTRDTAGNLHVQELCKAALAAKPGEMFTHRHVAAAGSSGPAVPRLDRVAYYAPWDWAIAAGAPEDELYHVVHEIEQASTAGQRLQLGVSLTAIVLCALVWLWVASRITRRLDRSVTALAEGATQVASASTQISTASQSLAHGASQQAASVEETTSALTEMSSMTRNSAQTANQAASLAHDVQASAQGGNQAMERMNQAMAQIDQAAAETARIIKLIDEIAFQTNLLALNAAVEAARAGEAGKGFAVVAEEVRNLAMRSAEAARNTAAMIEQSKNAARNGVGISGQVAQALQSIHTSSTRLAQLVNEIASASQETATGIGQVNTAISQVDQSTQGAAANAEQSAAAAEELSAQAQTLHGIVGDLVSLVRGGESTASTPTAPDACLPPANLQPVASTQPGHRNRPAPLSRAA